jgi:predicted MFS family arabinose efflux permease
MKRSLNFQIPIFVAARIVINTMQRMVYPFLPVFGRGLGVDLQMLSLALTLRSSSGIFGPLLASLGDSRGRKVGMLFGLLLLIAGAGVMVIWPVYPAFVAMLILGMMSNFVFIPSMQAYLGDRVPYQRRGLVLALTELGWSLSFIVGVPAMGWLIARYGWQAPFPALALLGILALLTLGTLLPGDKPEKGTQPGMWHNLGQVFTSMPAVAGMVMGISLSGGNEMVNLIFGVWLEDAFQVRIAALAAASAIIGFSELGGELLTSAVVDRLGKRRAATLGLALNSLAALALPALGSSLNGALVGLFFFYLTFEFTIVSTIPLMTEVLPATRATFMALFIASTALGRSIGSLISPILYRLGQGGELGGILAVALATVALDLCAIALLRIVREGVKLVEPEMENSV